MADQNHEARTIIARFLSNSIDPSLSSKRRAEAMLRSLEMQNFRVVKFKSVQRAPFVIDDPFAPDKLCDCVGPNEAEPQPCHCGKPR